MLSKKITVCIVLLAILGYYLYIPIRPGISKPWKLRTLIISQNIVRNIIKLAAFFKVNSKPKLLRSFVDLMVGSPPKSDAVADQGVIVQEQYFDTVRTLTFTPPGYKENGPGAAIIYYHGGGFVFGKPEYIRSFLIDLAKKSNSFVVAPAYRLAPEYPYPIPLEDCLHVTAEILRASNKYGINSSKVVLAGDSSGGNLAAAVSLKLLNDAQYSELPKVKLVAMFFPALQAFDFNTPSYQTYRYDLNKENVQDGISFWQLYMNGVEEDDIVQDVLVNNHIDEAIYNELHPKINWNMLPAENYKDLTYKRPSMFENHNTKARKVFDKALTDPYVSPLVASDDMLKGFPPTYMLTCEYDLLRDEGIMFKERLLKQSVPVTYVNSKFYHGVINVGNFGFTESHQAFNDFVNFLSTNL